MSGEAIKSGGGEVWDFDDVKLEAKRRKVDEAPGAGAAPETGSKPEPEPEPKSPEQAEKEKKEQELKEAVFEKVDTAAADELTRQFEEKIDAMELKKCYWAMEENFEVGALRLAEYLTGVLGLKEMPKVWYKRGMKRTTLGTCQKRVGGDMVKVNLERATQYNLTGQAETVAHECMHSYQHQIQDATDDESVKEQRERYVYNFQNYIDGDTDFEGYWKQLVEVEARSFGAMVRQKLSEFEPDEGALAQQVFKKVDRAEIQKVVGEKMGKFDPQKMFDAMGVADTEELAEYGGEKFAEVAPAAMEYLLGMLGVRANFTVLMANELKDGATVSFNIHEGVMRLSKAAMGQMDARKNLANMALYAWEAWQNDEVWNGQKSERGALYDYNWRNLQPTNWQTGEGTKQLVMMEARAFMKQLLNAAWPKSAAEQVAGDETQRLSMMERIKKWLGE